MKELAEEPIRQIIGIAGDTRSQGLDNDGVPMAYIPRGQLPDALNALMMSSQPNAWVVRTQASPASVSASIQEEIRLATGVPVTDVELMSDIVSISTSRERVNMLLMAIFAGSALLLAAIGIYGLMAYSVRQRGQEIGIRISMGAEPGHVIRMVVGQGMRLAAVGVVLGLAAAYFLANALASVLFEVEPRDPGVFVGVAVLLTVIAFAAVTVPAVRAGKMNPVSALRE
jgi:ABC-type antimicrobial peptide transport system permease subunit